MVVPGFHPALISESHKKETRAFFDILFFFNVIVIALLRQGFGGRRTPNGKKLQPSCAKS
mgnify:CR=1 FL=1